MLHECEMYVNVQAVLQSCFDPWILTFGENNEYLVDEKEIFAG